MDLYDAKDRIAVALVESIFRRARYPVRRAPRAANAPRFGREEFSPDFAVNISGRDGTEREFLVHVTYRPFVDQFIALENQRRDLSMLALARRQWPTLHLVLVTDHPESGRSCFQGVVFADRHGDALATVNLAEVAEFAIFPHNVTDHEELLLRIFAMLSPDLSRREISRAG